MMRTTSYKRYPASRLKEKLSLTKFSGHACHLAGISVSNCARQLRQTRVTDPPVL
jgi:hypothetical protein